MAFLVAPSSSSRTAMTLHAGRGFAKTTPPPSPSSQMDDDSPIVDTTTSSPLEATTITTTSPRDDSQLSPEERSKSILREKFGLKSYEEQRAAEGDVRAMVDQQAKEARRDKLRNIEKLWPEDKDVFEVLPPELLRGVDSVLKVGLGVCTVAFLLAGVFITIEAGSKATGNALPSGLDEWIVTVVEPNFTPLLGVLLGFSVSLGLFSAGQLGSKGSVYREDP